VAGNERALPDLVSRVRIDDTALDKTQAKSKGFSAAHKKQMKDAAEGNQAFGKSVGNLIHDIEQISPPAGRAAGALQNIAGTLGKFGVGLSAVGAITAIAVAANAAGERYEGLVTEITKFQRVSGASAAEASKLVGVLHIVGVNTDDASLAVFRLTKNLELAPEKLAKFGVEAQRDSKGNLDLMATLENVARAYTSTGDQAQRNALLFAAFGRSGTALIPVLEQGAAGLAALGKAVNLSITQEEIERVKQYQREEAQLKEREDELAAIIGGPVVQAKKANVEASLQNIYVNQHLNESIQKTLDAHAGSRVSTLRAAYALREEYEAAQKATYAAKDQAQAMKDAAQSALDEAKAMEDLYNADLAFISSQIAMEQAQHRLTDAQHQGAKDQQDIADAADAAAAAQKDYNDAVRAYGGGSAQAQRAAKDLRDAQQQLSDAQQRATDDALSLKQAYVDEAIATVKLARDQAAANHETLNGQQEAKIFRDELQRLTNALAPDSALRKYLQGYIDTLKNIPLDVTTTLTITGARAPGVHAGGHGAQEEFQGGGRPPVGVPSWFGERGRELYVPDRPGTVLNNDVSERLMAALSARPDSATPAQVSVTNHFNEVDADAQDIARDVGWELRKLRRFG